MFVVHCWKITWNNSKVYAVVKVMINTNAELYSMKYAGINKLKKIIIVFNYYYIFKCKCRIAFF